jgi:hypothetical protein
MQEELHKDDESIGRPLGKGFKSYLSASEAGAGLFVFDDDLMTEPGEALASLPCFGTG